MEQALVFASIIVGVAVSDQILSLNRLLRSEARTRWHWALPLLALLVMLTNVQVWWETAGQPDTKISIAQFLPYLVEFILLALLSAATLPDSIPADGIDLSEYYRRHARYMWLLYAGATAWLQGFDIIVAVRTGAPVGPLLQMRDGDWIALAIMIALAFVRRWWLVALGMAFLATGPIHWVSRTLS